MALASELEVTAGSTEDTAGSDSDTAGSDSDTAEEISYSNGSFKKKVAAVSLVGFVAMGMLVGLVGLGGFLFATEDVSPPQDASLPSRASPPQDASLPSRTSQPLKKASAVLWHIDYASAYCTNDDRIDLGAVTSVIMCQEVAVADARCGGTFYSNGEDACKCLPPGTTCQEAKSGKGNSVYVQGPTPAPTSCNPSKCITGLTCKTSPETCCVANDWSCCGTGTQKFSARLYCPTTGKFLVMCNSGKCESSEARCGSNGVRYPANQCLAPAVAPTPVPIVSPTPAPTSCNPSKCITGLTCKNSPDTCCAAGDWGCCGTGTTKLSGRLYCPTFGKYIVMCNSGKCERSEARCGSNGVRYPANQCLGSSSQTFLHDLKLPKICQGRPKQDKFPFGGGSVFALDVIAPGDYSTYQNDLTDDGRGKQRSMFDRRDGKFHTFSDAILFKCTFKYYHERSGPTVYVLRVRANPTDFVDHAEVRKYIIPFLESLGRQPEIAFQNLEYFTFHKGKHPWGGNSRVKDILVYTNSYVKWMGETLLHELAHCSLDGVLPWEPYREAIEADCDEFYTAYAKDHPKREGIAESFLLYFAVRFRRDRLTTAELEHVLSYGPNRMKYFEEYTPFEMTMPPLRPKAASATFSAKRIQDYTVKHVHEYEPNITLTPEEEEEAISEYMPDEEGFFTPPAAPN